MRVHSWEYRRISVEIGEVAGEAFLQRLAAAGAEGWELVTSIMHERHGYSHEVHLLFKRSAAG